MGSADPDDLTGIAVDQNRALIGGMAWQEEPEILRFFYGRLAPLTDWPTQLVAQFRSDFGDSL